ncbi:hypothetical protein [Streptomyces sp. NPDC101150]|uniref:hypothetical protein n=1 Tax=Streptomyces sp. NPDC101150 TaxID=3366114 RepID=UPI00381221FC
MSLRPPARTRPLPPRPRSWSPPRFALPHPPRPIAVLLLLCGLLLTVLPCSGAGGADHHRPPGITVASSAGHAPVAQAPDPDGPHAECGHGTAGRIPQGRAAVGDGGAPLMGLVATVAAVVAVRRPAVASGSARCRPARGGRRTLAVLCRCRI